MSKYKSYSDSQIKNEYNRIKNLPGTSIQSITDMNDVMEEMKMRNININNAGSTRQTTSSSNQTSARRNNYQEESSSGGGAVKMVLGLVIAGGGLAASAGTNSIFYGAILVGIFMFFGGLFDMAK